MVQEKPSSSRPVPTAEELEAIEELMSTGKRHYICNEAQLALDCFVELCETLANIYGQTADECAEAYLYYGKTLLEMARLENGVLGHAIKEAPVLGEKDEDTETDTKATDPSEDDEELTSEKKMALKAEVQHALRDGNLYNDITTEDETEEEPEVDATEAGGESSSVNETTTEQNKITSSTDTQAASTAFSDVQATEASSDTQTAAASSGAQTSKDATETVEDIEDINEEGGEEDISNMQLSWEMFELTAFICNRQIKRNTKDLLVPKKMLAEAKYGLAQISLESEHYEEAVKDFTSCVSLYQEILEDKNDRRIAEAHYNIALSLSFDKKFEEAIEQYKCAVNILQSRIAELEKELKEEKEKGGKEKASPRLEELMKEISELRDLVVLDMMAKIEDAQEMKKQLDESVQTVKEAAKEIFSSLAPSSGFDQGFSDGFDTPMSTDATEIVHDCSKNIRSLKRKSNNEDTITNDVKKVKQTNNNSEQAKVKKLNDKTTNGHPTEV